MKIGFFDSGIGGLSVLHHALKLLPNEQFLFYADKEHVPYGEKTPEEILRYTKEAAEFMIDHQVKAIVIACNTATSVAVEQLRRDYSLPIISMEPAVKKAVELYTKERVLVCATPVTVCGQRLHRLIERVDTDHRVDLLALPALVRFAEKNDFTSDEVKSYLRSQLNGFDLEAYSAIVLGCTHFNYFKDSLRAILPEHVKFVDGNAGTVQQLIRKLKENDLLENNEQRVDFYYSALKVESERELGKIAGLFERLDRMMEIE